MLASGPHRAEVRRIDGEPLPPGLARILRPIRNVTIEADGDRLLVCAVDKD